jgi:hypothetical protein
VASFQRKHTSGVPQDRICRRRPRASRATPRLADLASFDSTTAIAFEIGRIARPYNIEILYGPLFGRHLEGGLCAGKLYLLTCVQARDYLRRGCAPASTTKPAYTMQAH